MIDWTKMKWFSWTKTMAFSMQSWSVQTCCLCAARPIASLTGIGAMAFSIAKMRPMNGPAQLPVWLSTFIFYLCRCILCILFIRANCCDCLFCQLIWFFCPMDCHHCFFYIYIYIPLYICWINILNIIQLFNIWKIILNDKRSWFHFALFWSILLNTLFEMLLRWSMVFWLPVFPFSLRVYFYRCTYCIKNCFQIKFLSSHFLVIILAHFNLAFFNNISFFSVQIHCFIG